MLNHHFNLAISPCYTLLILSIFLMSGVIILTLNIFFIAKLFLLVWLMTYLFYLLHRHIFLISKRAILSLTKTEFNWQIATREKVLIAVLQGSSVVTSFLCILNFKLPDKNSLLTIVIFKDALHADDYRKLLVTLRMF